MQIKFSPCYQITLKISSDLLRIERVKEKIPYLPLTPSVLASLRETARLMTTHYSTMIEGNLLEPDEVRQVINEEVHLAGRERDENEVKGYYSALRLVEEWAIKRKIITEQNIQTLHAHVMRNGRVKVSPTLYRDGQNVIRDARTKKIVYMPPEAKDVPVLMKSLVAWISEQCAEIPAPILAAIAHYQFATIHPYYDGNGRTARLLTTLILHMQGYDLKGLYSLEEYYAKYLSEYYEAISIGPSHNYYLGRAEADITKWIEYFVEGMASSFEAVLKKMTMAQQEGKQDHSKQLRALDPRQRRALELFQQFEIITSRQISELFNFKVRTGALLCQTWVEDGFLEIVNPSNKKRTYRLCKKYALLL